MRLPIAGLIVGDSLKVQTTFGVLTLPEVGVHQAVIMINQGGGVILWRTMTVDYKLELVVHPFGLSQLTKLSTIYGSHWTL